MARASIGGVAVGVLVVLLVALPGILNPATVTPFEPANIGLDAVSGEVNSSFFGVNVHVVGGSSVPLQYQLARTPFVSLRFGPLGEATDQIHSVTYNQSGVPSPSYEATDASFVSECEAIHCQATMMVPAEIDDPAEAAATVLYVEKNLSFHPQYWAIGNEPQQWNHWGIPWTLWKPTDTSTPSAMQYADEVQLYVIAMRAVDPSIQIIGLESVVGGTIDAQWFRDVVAVDGPNLSAVAYHAYPGGAGLVAGSVANFDAALTNPLAFPLNYPMTQRIVEAACPACHISLFVDEFNAALGGNFSTLMTSYSEVPFIAAALVGALQEGVQRVLFFDLEDLNGVMPYGLLTGQASPRPAFLLFSGILDHLVLGSVRNASIEGGPGGTSAVLTQNETSASLLIVNANVTTGLTLSLPSSFDNLTGPATPFYWDPGTSGPVVGLPVANPAAFPWQLPPQSVVLLEWGAL